MQPQFCHRCTWFRCQAAQFLPKADHGSLDLPQAHLIPLPSSPISAKGGPWVFRPTTGALDSAAKQPNFRQRRPMGLYTYFAQSYKVFNMYKQSRGFLPMPEKGEEWCTNPRKTSPYLTYLQLLCRGNPRVLAARRKTALQISDAGAKKEIANLFYCKSRSGAHW